MAPGRHAGPKVLPGRVDLDRQRAKELVRPEETVEDHPQVMHLGVVDGHRQHAIARTAGPGHSVRSATMLSQDECRYSFCRRSRPPSCCRAGRRRCTARSPGTSLEQSEGLEVFRVDEETVGCSSRLSKLASNSWRNVSSKKPVSSGRERWREEPSVNGTENPGLLVDGEEPDPLPALFLVGGDGGVQLPGARGQRYAGDDSRQQASSSARAAS